MSACSPSSLLCTVPWCSLEKRRDVFTAGIAGDHAQFPRDTEPVVGEVDHHDVLEPPVACHQCRAETDRTRTEDSQLVRCHDVAPVQAVHAD